MLKVNEVSFAGAQQVGIDSSANVQQKKPYSYRDENLFVCRYSQDDIQDLLKELGIDTKSYNVYPNFYQVVYDKKNNCVSIDNKSRTNDTVVILADGSVRHCGSWHDKEIAPKGSFSGIVDKVKAHVEKYALDGASKTNV